MTERKLSGVMGEEIARQYLQQKGVDLLAVNWRWNHLEIDIVGIHEKKLIIYEVKTRKSAEFGDPASFVNRKKQRLLIKAANEFISQYKIKLEAQFDIIAILYQNKTYEITHIESAFQPGF